MFLWFSNQYTPNQGYATAQPYPPPAQAQVTQGPQAYAATSADAYVISGYTRPAQQNTAAAAAQQNYYAQQQNQQGGYAAPTPGKVQAQARPAQASTAYPTYTANTAGVTGTTSYAGFAQPQQQQQQQANTSKGNYY